MRRRTVPPRAARGSALGSVMEACVAGPFTAVVGSATGSSLSEFVVLGKALRDSVWLCS